MSAYASLPGSFLPPFFAFGGGAPSSATGTGSATAGNGGNAACEPNTRTDGPGAGTGDNADDATTSVRDAPPPAGHADPRRGGEGGDGQSSSSSSPSLCAPSCTTYPSDKIDDTSAFRALSLLSPPVSTSCSASCGDDGDMNKCLSHPPSNTSKSSPPADIIVDIHSARVDTMTLIRSLTSSGSRIARRTKNFITRSPPQAAEASTDGGGDGEDAGDEEKDGGEASSYLSPGLCYDDSSDDSDEEYSMYDYGDDDDFSDQHAQGNGGGDGDDNEGDERDGSAMSSDEDPSAIEFELSITFQGRKYNATRAFPTFVKLRNDLIREVGASGDGGDGASSHHNCRHRGGVRRHYGSNNSLGGSKSAGSLSDTAEKDGASLTRCGGPISEAVSVVPELPRVTPQSLGHSGFALSGVARSGFALLQSVAQHYCPEMESWMKHVIDAFPYSQSLSSFLWEPLASTETIGEETESSSGSPGGGDGRRSPLPPLHGHRGRPKASSLSAKGSRFKPSGGGSGYMRSNSCSSTSSLGSIEEGHGDCDSDSDRST